MQILLTTVLLQKAGKVQLSFFPVGDAYVSILDNGTGMDDAQMNIAMQYGSKSPTETRDSSDLGRYGLGLKTASLSQCRVFDRNQQTGRSGNWTALGS